MILLESSAEWRCAPLTFSEGAFYVEAQTAAAALASNEGVKVRTVENPLPWDATLDWNGKRVLLVRSGGFGDLLFLTPLLRSMRARWPGISMSFAVTPYYREALMGNPFLDALVNYPVRWEVLESYDAVIWFEGLIEWSPKARTVNSVDLHAEFAGVDLTEGRNMEFHGHEVHLESMRRRFPRPGRLQICGTADSKSALLENCKSALPRVGVQVSASVRCRTYPGKLMSDLIGRLMDFSEVVLFDTPRTDEPEEKVPGLIVLPTERPPLSFGQSCAVLADCDAVVAPDSALLHVAGALGLPAVGLYGAFPWQLRTVHAPSIHGINGTCRVSPCFWHDRESVWPPEGPCAKSGRCEALGSIEPRRIAGMVRRMVAKQRSSETAKVL